MDNTLAILSADLFALLFLPTAFDITLSFVVDAVSLTKVLNFQSLPVKYHFDIILDWHLVFLFPTHDSCHVSIPAHYILLF